jgi:hypothetical protein
MSTVSRDPQTKPAPLTERARAEEVPPKAMEPRSIEPGEWLGWGVFGVVVSALWIGVGGWLWKLVAG